MRKFMISAVATLAAVGALGAFAPAALAIPPTTTPTTPPSEVGGYPPVPTSSSTTTTQAQSLGPPVVITPPADVDDAAIAGDADLPSTGSDSMVPLQVAAGLLVAGILAVFAVRRRRQASPEPAA